MMRLIKPIAVALKGKGPSTTIKRAQTIGKRYGMTVAKMDRSLESLAGILQQFDCRATLPITAVALARHGAAIHKYQSQGIEFAIHGYLHVDYSQLSSKEQLSHLREAVQVFRDHDIDYDGFRCPYLRWNEHTLTALGQNNLNYDSSTSLVWDVEKKHITESYDRALSFYGARSAADYPALPALEATDGLVRVPYCLPDDEALVERLRWNGSGEMNGVWPVGQGGQGIHGGTLDSAVNRRQVAPNRCPIAMYNRVGQPASPNYCA